MKGKLLSHVQPSAAPWTAAFQAPPSMGFSRQDRLLKSRDITLPIKVHLVKAMVFPVVMYACESWTIKKAEKKRKLSAEELMLLNCGVEEDS